MKVIAKKIGYFLVSLIGAMLVGTIALTAVYALPVEPIRENARESIPVFLTEGDAFYWVPGYDSTHLDGFTDSLMVNNAVFLGTGSVWNDAMMNQYVKYDGNEKFSQNLISALQTDTLDGAHVVNYPRYWHGYLVWLKPAMEFLNYQQIRLLNMAVQSLLSAIVLYMIAERMGKQFAFALLGTILVINPVSTILCLEHSCMYIITLMTILGIFLYAFRDIEKKSWKVFLWSGIATAYFDFLTYPAVALGVPLIITVCLFTNHAISKQLRLAVENSLFWGAGYICMWGGKWVISTVSTNYNTIQDGLTNFFSRAGGLSPGMAADTEISAANAIRMNFDNINGVPFKLILLSAVLAAVYFVIFKKYRVKFDVRIPVLALIGTYPFIWYSVLKNHSIMHNWMTYRELAIFLFAILCAICVLVKKRDVEDGSNSRSDTLLQ